MEPLRLSQHAFFAGLVLKGSIEDIQKVKNYITKKTNLKIIYQHNDIRYLTIQIAQPTNTPDPESDILTCTP